MAKIYCRNCDFFRPNRCDGYPRDKCEFDVKIRVVDWYDRQNMYVELGDPKEKNANNDCKDFKPTAWFRFKCWLASFRRQ